MTQCIDCQINFIMQQMNVSKINDAVSITGIYSLRSLKKNLCIVQITQTGMCYTQTIQ